MQYHREEELKNRLNNFFITKFSLPEDDYYSRLDSEKIISLGGVSKSMLALNKSVIKVKESQIKGFKMIFELFRKVATSPKLY